MNLELREADILCSVFAARSPEYCYAWAGHRALVSVSPCYVSPDSHSSLILSPFLTLSHTSAVASHQDQPSPGQTPGHGILWNMW